MDDCSSFLVPSCCFMLIQHIWAIESLTTSHQQHWFRFLPLGCTFIFLTPSIFRSVSRPAACVRLTMTPIWPASPCSTATTRPASPFIKHWGATGLILERQAGEHTDYLLWNCAILDQCIWEETVRHQRQPRGLKVPLKMFLMPESGCTSSQNWELCGFIAALSLYWPFGLTAAVRNEKKKSQILLKHKTVWLQTSYKSKLNKHKTNTKVTTTHTQPNSKLWSFLIHKI